MNWDAIGAIGEIVGAIAVLATLIYLAIQIRQNSAIQRAQTHQQLALERVNGVRLITTNKELRDAVGKARFGKPLTEDEQGILFWMTVMHLREYENELYQHSQGMIEDDELEVQKTLLEFSHMQIEAVEKIALHSFTPKTQEVIRALARKKSQKSHGANE